MVLFSIKLLNNVRKAIAGRRFPKQLAAAVALGTLLGVVPHGNLLAVVILVSILCCQVNHALMATVAICVSFGATHLDPYSHQTGEFVLNHPSVQPLAITAWQLPFIPWTDLNNTVVMGSFLIGLAATLPIYYLTLPLFRMIAPEETEQESKKGDAESNNTRRLDDSHAPSEISKPFVTTESADPATMDTQPEKVAEAKDQADTTKHSVSLFVDESQPTQPPRFAGPELDSPELDSPELDSPEYPANTAEVDQATSSQEPMFVPIEDRHDGGDSSGSELPTHQEMVAVETRIDVIRIQGPEETLTPENQSADDQSDRPNTDTNHEQPMDEALNYLLRQLRHSQERKAAG